MESMPKVSELNGKIWKRQQGRLQQWPRERHDATCAERGKTCPVPFKPDGSRPVYCSDCYQKHKPASLSRPPRRY